MVSSLTRGGWGRTSAAMRAGRRRRDRGRERVGDDLADGVERRQMRGHAETRCQRDEVGPGQFGGGGLAERIGHVLAQDAVAAVVDDQPRDVGVVLAGGGQLGDRVHGTAVAGDRERALAGADRRGDRGGEGEPEPARALRGVELAVARIPRRPRPVRRRSSCPRTSVPQRERRRADRASASARRRRPDRRAASSTAVAGPRRSARRRRRRAASPASAMAAQGEAASAWIARAGMVGLQHPRFGVDVDQPAPRREGEVVARHLAHRGADGQQDVGVLEQRRWCAGPRSTTPPTADGRTRIAPLPPTVETTGASSSSARATSASEPAGRAPHSAAGQDHRPLAPSSSSAAAASTSSARGGRSATVVDHRRAPAARRSARAARPAGSPPTSARRARTAPAPTRRPAGWESRGRRRTTAVLLVTLTALRCWSSSWCSMPRRSPSPARGTWLVITSSGTPGRVRLLQRAERGQRARARWTGTARRPRRWPWRIRRRRTRSCSRPAS